ncbi:MAG: lysophospholipase [Lachnospiraceae bacterium]|nr:lysophospholipase [Candidatus Colinaster equi]
MTKQEFYYDSRDNKSRIHAVKWVPEKQPKGIAIIVHGMAEHMGRYEYVAGKLCDAGYVVAGNDHLGHGGSINENPKGFFCKQDPATVAVRDVHRLKKMLQKEYPELPVFVYGHSMGSLIARCYISKYGTGIDGVVLSGTIMLTKIKIIGMGAILAFLTFFAGSKHVSEFVNTMATGSYLKRISNPRTKFDWLSHDEVSVDEYVADDLCGFTFTLNGFRTLKDLLFRMHDRKALNMIPKNLPILMVYGSEDPCGDYGVAVQAVYDQYKTLGIEDVVCKKYEGDRHEIHNEADKDNLMSEICSWMDAHIEE